MTKKKTPTLLLLAVTALTFGLGNLAVAEDAETPSQAGENVGIEGQFVRVAENDEAWVVLGYRTANESVNQEWMLIDIGMTVQNGVKDQTITRDDVTLMTPDHKVLPLPTQKEYEGRGGHPSVSERAGVDAVRLHQLLSRRCRTNPAVSDSSPTPPNRGGRSPSTRSTSAASAACLGRVYFQIPGGIQYGLYNLDVKFADSTIRVPVKIMDKEDAKAFEKQWKEEKKEDKK